VTRALNGGLSKSWILRFTWGGEERKCGLAFEGTIARALEFTILTAAGTDEALGATWPEINLSTNLWIIPPIRKGEWMKPRREHRIPLVPRVVEILEKLYATRYNDYVFPSDRNEDAPLSNAVMRSLLNELREGKGFTVHGEAPGGHLDWAERFDAMVGSQRRTRRAGDRPDGTERDRGVRFPRQGTYRAPGRG
jgi:Phage integrase family